MSNSQGVKLPIYMDNHSTTPLDPRALEAMLPYLTDKFGNASSHNHRFGWDAERAVEKARQQVATLLSATPEEIVFTSGATESDNLAVKGVAAAHAEKGNHIVTVVTEHKAVLDSCKTLQKSGQRITFLPVQADGLICLKDLERAIDPSTVLVSVMFANNETGVLQPIAEIGELCRSRGVLFHTDAAQAVGKVPIDVNALHIDLLSISAHKLYGPKGAGVLYVRGGNSAVKLQSLMDGGGHEHGMRSGTLNVPGIVGLGKAAELCTQELQEESRRLRSLRDRLKARLIHELDAIHIHGSMDHRLPGNLNVGFSNVEGELLFTALDDVAVSHGAACFSASTAPSYVLKALGVDDDLASSSIRFGIGRFNTEAEVDHVAERVVTSIRKLRELSPSRCG